MSLGDQIEDRLIDFAVRAINVCNQLPKTSAGKHISRQLVRSATSPAPNYAEARGAESQKDFVHKLKIVLKELNESRVWLKMIVRSSLLDVVRLEPLQVECEELCKIVGASIRTSIKNSDQSRIKEVHEFYDTNVLE